MEQSFLKSKRLLLVEDEIELLKMEALILKEEGFENLIFAVSKEEGAQLAYQTRPDLILLDVMLPDGSGFDLMREIRMYSNVPVIFVTARDQPIDKIDGLRLGADDYIVKPFLAEELLLRIYAILRRCYREEEKQLQLAGSVLDFSRGEVKKGNQTIRLTAMEYNLLLTLSKNVGRIVSVDTLCEGIWGEVPFGYENSLNAHIRRVREKIEKDPSHPVSLITLKGLGYKLMAGSEK